MKFIDSIKNVLLGKPDEQTLTFQQTIEESFDEVQKTSRSNYTKKITSLDTYKNKVSKWTEEQKINFIICCIQQSKKYNSGSYNSARYAKSQLIELYIKQLFRNKLLFSPENVAQLVDAMIRSKVSATNFLNKFGLALMLNQIEKQYTEPQGNEKVTLALEDLRKTLTILQGGYEDNRRKKYLSQVESILFHLKNGSKAIEPSLWDPSDSFAVYTNETINKTPVDERLLWYKLIHYAQKAKGGKPTKKYLKEADLVIKELGEDSFKNILNDWITSLIQRKEELTEYKNGAYAWTGSQFITSSTSDTMKGFLWISSLIQDPTLVHNISSLAERCYKKIPGQGPAAGAVGNACFYALYACNSMNGIGQLSRLKVKIKQTNAKKLIQKYLLQAAQEQGVSLNEIEDLSIEHFGLEQGKRTWAFDEYKAELVITGIGKSLLQWYKPDGKSQKSIPAFVKKDHADALKSIKKIKKQVNQITSAQRDRLDRMFRIERKWTFEKFNTSYLQHGLMSFLVKSMIWTFEKNGVQISATFFNGDWITNENKKFTPDTSYTVSLWHPACQAVTAIKKWRDFLYEHKIQQPLKQAYREVYLLTEAEINTKSYSNRMAAHILKQHQYVMLAKGRNWQASLLGGWDGGDNDGAELDIPEYNIRAEFWIQAVAQNDQMNDAGIWNYISTDQIRFIDLNTDNTIDLIDVPKTLFSEVFRDVDLFVGVASVGNDPTWSDSGGLPIYRDYWSTYSFGDLSTIAKNRKEILENLVPRLNIGKVAEVKGKFLVVQGKLRMYKIHIGSTNILMEPNDEYLCIVPDRNKKNVTQDVFLPFEGDNALSIILSKAMLLAADDKITDSTIISQIQRR
jgi:hypothetical protein